MFLENAQLGQNHFWRYLVTTVLLVTVYIMASLPFGAAILLLDGNINATGISDAGLNINLALGLALLSPVVGFFALWWLVQRFHKRSFKSVLTAREKLDWSRIFFGAGLWLFLGLGMEFVAYLLNPGNFSLIFEWKLFLPLLLVALVMLPIQTSFEEAFFRGYLMQGVGRLSRFRWLPLVFTSVLFGAMHLFNPEVRAFGLGYMSFFYIGMGLVFGIITIMDDGTEIALGMHAINNLTGALLLTYESSALETPAIFKMNHLDPQVMVIGWAVAVAIYLAIVWRRYKWGSWRKLIEQQMVDS